MSEQKVRKKIAFVGNSALTMMNFRLGVMRELTKEYDVVMLSPQDCNVGILKKNNIRFIPTEMDCKGMNPFVDLALVMRLYRIYKREQFDIIFHYTIKPVIYGGWAARWAGIPQMSFITGLGYTFIKTGIINHLACSLYRSSLKTAEEVWFLNQEDKTLFLERKIIVPHKARVMNGEGVDVNYYQTTKPLVHKPFRFLFIGRILSDKGICEYVEAAQIIRKRQPEVSFQILGSLGANNPACITQDQMHQWEKSGDIQYLGETTNVIPFIEKASCIVLPSYREGVSRVLMEAASMQMPIIASNVPGCREVVRNNETGILCEPKNTSSLVVSMMYMLSLSEEERETMGRKAREFIVKNFNEKNIIQLYQERLKEYFHTV